MRWYPARYDPWLQRQSSIQIETARGDTVCNAGCDTARDVVQPFSKNLFKSQGIDIGQGPPPFGGELHQSRRDPARSLFIIPNNLVVVAAFGRIFFRVVAYSSIPVWNVSRSEIAPGRGKIATLGTRRECHRSQGLGIHRETLNRTLNRTPLLLLRSDGRLFTQTQGCHAAICCSSHPACR